jgi:hypothetical protein
MLLKLKQLCWIPTHSKGCVSSLECVTCSFAGPRCDPLRLKPTDWESAFDRQRKNFADPGNASACASPTAALLLEGRTHLLRLLQEIPLGEAEQAAVEDGVAAYENLLSKLSDVPTPAGPTPRQLGAGLVRITSVRPASPASTLRTREVTALEVESQINSRNSRRI